MQGGFKRYIWIIEVFGAAMVPQRAVGSPALPTRTHSHIHPQRSPRPPPALPPPKWMFTRRFSPSLTTPTKSKKKIWDCALALPIRLVPLPPLCAWLLFLYMNFRDSAQVPYVCIFRIRLVFRIVKNIGKGRGREMLLDILRIWFEREDFCFHLHVISFY